MTTPRKDIVRNGGDGNPRAQEVATLVFYVRHPHLAIAEGIISRIKAFVALVSYRTLALFFDDNGYASRLNERALALVLAERFDPTIPNGHLELESDENLAPAFALTYSGNALTTPGMNRKTSYLRCWVPRSYFLDHRQEIEAFFDETARTLPFSFAYLNFALSGEDRRLKQRLARRYPGLDIAEPVSVGMDLGDQAAGVYWLNLLGPELTAKLGGVEKIRAALPNGVEVDAFNDETCRVRLGNMPKIGDVNRGRFLQHHRDLARFFEQQGVLHLPRHVVYHVDDRGAPDREAMETWHRRFLAPLDETES